MRVSIARRCLRLVHRTAVRARELITLRVLRPVLRAVPVTSLVIGPPRGVYESAEDWWAGSERVDGERIIHLAGPLPIVRTAPKTVDSHVHPKLKDGAIGLTDESYKAFVAVISGGRVCGTSGAVISPDDRILLDVSLEFMPRCHHSLLGQWKLPPSRMLSGRCAVLATAGSHNYYHWMVNALPRLAILKRAGYNVDVFDHILVGTQSAPFHRETLSTLGVRKDQIVSLRDNPHVQAEILMVPSLVGEPGNVPNWVSDFLVEAFLPAASQRPERRIYVSRRDSQGRRVTNEAQVIDFLISKGFECTLLSNMPVVDQARLFADAAIVVAPHGAGLTNVVFCAPGARVVELFSPFYVNGCYWTLCSHAQVDYYYLIGAGERPASDLHSHVVDADITVDLTALARVLARPGVQ
jgi:capsular polysaccharide biosynthesis protein